MNRKDYSKDVIETQYMLSNELIDYDTKNHNWTGINTGRMRLPTRYDISKYYKRQKRNRELGSWKRRDEELVDFGGDDFDWQITYSFPPERRNPVTAGGKVYGGLNVTLRRLYLILCEHFNGGRFFIDDYFESVYPHTVKPEIDERLETIKSELLEVASEELEGAVATKSGRFDRRYKVNRGMKAKQARYESFASAWEENEGIYLANIIKDDIINCLMSGQIPLEIPFDTPGTQHEREKAGLSKTPRFFATAQLIESIQLYVKIGGNRQWQTRQGILV